MDLLFNVLGAGGTVAVIAFFIDLLEKSLGKQGLFKDIGSMAKDAGTGLGKFISGAIPGSKVEPELEEIFRHVEGWEDKFMENFLDSLNPKDKNGGE